MSTSVTLQFPASTANLGPGFDSLGLALNLYLTLEITRSSDWKIECRSPLLSSLPTDETNLIYQVATLTAERYNAVLPPLHIVIDSEIPLARGLGSSAAAIAAGIEVANYFAQLELTLEEKLLIGNEIEGHPDNIGACIFGGLVAGVSIGEVVEVVQLPKPNIDIVVTIPPYEVKTEVARKVLPEQLTREEAVLGSAVANVLIAALLTENYELAGKMMEKDRFHEPHRLPLIPELTEARNFGKEAGAIATVISGAGPTILTFAPKGTGEYIASLFQRRFSHCTVKQLQIHCNNLEYNY
ncbi:homoserine kinase [Sutcliffiella cohnii]|uniref:Homoserine kinase n=1 Tax=Sutcliffiella cohnii TaxID=33932 RepID=A0A223KLG9_9BACI|nr:homoserine kinase [Sutcliffiella cohnii]AST90183.1 homoserine kinase [Sutcliffiella cohnii]